MSDDTFNCWIPFRMCNGYGANRGKWGVLFQKAPREKIHVAQRPSGGPVVYATKAGAQGEADHLNNIGATP